MPSISEAIAAGLAHHQAGRMPEAEQAYRHVLAADPQNVAAWHLLGRLAQQAGRLDVAIMCIEQAVQLRPDYAEAFLDLGTAFKDAGNLEQAIASFQRALGLNPRFAEAHYNLGLAFHGQERLEQAIACYERTLELRPDMAQAHYNLGVAFENQGRLTEAVACCRRSLQLAPDYPSAHFALGFALQRLGRLDDALACFGRAIALKADFADAHWRRSVVRLIRGDFQDGWAGFEWRFKCPGYIPRSFAQPMWNGDSLEGKTILLHAEQGLGDTIQFLRYVPLVKRRGGRVVLECQKSLVPLLRSAPVDQLVGHGSPLPPFDVQAPLLSLPGIFQTTLDSIPADVPYLFPAPQLVDAWREKLKDVAGFRVGIGWQGNPAFREDRERSFTLAWFAPLAQIPGVRLIRLQKGAGSEQLAALGRVGCAHQELRGDAARTSGEMVGIAHPTIVDLGDDVDTVRGAFMDTAAIMMNLDLVITSDTAIAHLAGALGVPVWVALPFVPDWRWLLDRSDSPWYPTMRLFRQKTSGDWAGVFREIEAALRQRLQL